MTSPWIRIKDRLPEEGQKVVLSDEYGQYDIGELATTDDGHRWKHEEYDGPAYSKLLSWVYWRPIPPIE
jgi:hypothetical protein